MVRYYGRARQITGTVNTNQLGLKQAGCPGTVGKSGRIIRFLGQRVNCNLKTCGLPMSGLRCIYGVGDAIGRDKTWADIEGSDNPAIEDYCKMVVNGDRGTFCTWPQPENRQLAGGVGNIWTPRRSVCPKNCSLGYTENVMTDKPPSVGALGPEVDPAPVTPVVTFNLGSRGNYQRTLTVSVLKSSSTNKQDVSISRELMVDTGNGPMYYPNWADISGNALYSYTNKGGGKEKKEPDSPQTGPSWPVSGYYMVGPILLGAGDNTLLIPKCHFFACTGPDRHANFGCNNVKPPSGISSPLFYTPICRYLEISFSPAPVGFGPRQDKLKVYSEFPSKKYMDPTTATMIQQHPSEYGGITVSCYGLTLKGNNNNDVFIMDPSSPPLPMMLDTGGGPLMVIPQVSSVENLREELDMAPSCPAVAGQEDCICAIGPYTLSIGKPASACPAQTTICAKPYIGMLDELNGPALICTTNTFLFDPYKINTGANFFVHNDVLLDFSGSLQVHEKVIYVSWDKET